MHWEEIAESLRQELAGYGGILHLFELQQRALAERDLDKVVERCPAIEARALALASRRKERERLVAAFALEHGRPANSTIRSLLDVIDIDARPLLEALVGEVNCLLHRARAAGRHNQAVLSRSLALDSPSRDGRKVGIQPASPVLERLLTDTNPPQIRRVAG
jgi:FlgN protein